MDCNDSLMDIVNIVSFVIGLMNLDENLTQNDKQELMQSLNNKGDALLAEIHQHLQQQDQKIDRILKLLEEGR